MKTFTIPPEIDELLAIREAEILELEKEVQRLNEQNDLYARSAFYEGRLINNKLSNNSGYIIFEYPTFEGWKRGDRPKSQNK